ncbi:hypothetical protein QIS74_13430 [Colletotrichum tabaci]|uniref:Uncharacterized protein n=1 Tax=Colletotrichum tabaci TaxID=1209068 RepID=A0AAV9SVQ9_9PEZI
MPHLIKVEGVIASDSVIAVKGVTVETADRAWSAFQERLPISASNVATL